MPTLIERGLQDAKRLRRWAGALFLVLSRLSFAGLLVLIPFSWRTVLQARPFPPIYKDYTDFMLTASDRLLLATLVFWAVSLLLMPRRFKWGPLFFAVPLAGLTAVSALSTLTSVDPALSLYQSGRLVLLGLLYLFIVNEVRSLDSIVLPVALQVLVQSVVGLVQFLAQHSVGLERFGELLLDPSWKGVSIVWSGQSVLLRVYGLSDHPNILGGALAFGLVVLLYWYLKSSSVWKTPIAAVIALGLMALLLTFSRAAWIALAAGSALFVILLWRAGAREATRDLLALGVATGILLLPFLWQYSPYLGVRLNPAEPSTSSGENRSIVERDTLNRAGDAIFADHAVLGVGLGAFPLALRTAEPSFPFDYQPAHLTLIEVAAETGIFGALFYGLLMLLPWAAIWLHRRRLRSDPATLALIATLALLLTISIVGLFDYYTWVLVPGRLWQWVAWGVWVVAYSRWTEVQHG